MHGAWSGGPFGSRNGAFKTGKYTREAKEVSAFFREMARDGEALLATTLDAHGLRRKIPKQLRRRSPVERALAKAKASKGEKTE